MKKRAFAFICVFILIVSIPALCFADTGPKPSVTIDFEGLGNEECYAALLSFTPSTGPWSVEVEYRDYFGEREIWEAFKSYKDADGYYFVNIFYEVSETGRLHHGYYPPSNFKILLYYPESGQFAASEPLSRYAFESFFEVSVSGHEIVSTLSNPNKAAEIAGLAVRILITLLIELGLALLFRLRKARQIIVILCANIVTQIALNMLLRPIVYYSAPLFILLLFLLELAVFVIEALCYMLFIRDVKPSRLWIYSAVANLASLVLGGVLALLLNPAALF